MASKKEKRIRSFAELWKICNNQDLFTGLGWISRVDLFRKLFNAADTFPELCAIFEATYTKLDDILEYSHLTEVRRMSLKALIETAKNREEALIALKFATKRKRDRTYWFPARAKEAQMRLKDFPAQKST